MDTEQWQRASQTPPAGVFILSGRCTDEIQGLLPEKGGESRFGKSIDGLCQTALNFSLSFFYIKPPTGKL